MSIFGALRNTVNTFSVLDRAVEVVQNNIGNASTPGYVRQTLPLYARPFEVESLLGGVGAGALKSSRDSYNEAMVRQQLNTWGALDQKSSALAKLELLFDVSGKSGVGASMTRLLQSFSAWSVTPNSGSSRQDVLNAAGRLAADFRSFAGRASQEVVTLERQAHNVVDQVNSLVSVVRNHNNAQRQLASHDPGREAQLFETLERLSELVGVSAISQDDGTITVLLAGEYPLLIGDRQNFLELDIRHDSPPPPIYPEAPGSAHVVSADGTDLSSRVHGGRLGGLLELRNNTMGSLLGTGSELGTINELALAFAERVNSISTDAGGPALFTYDAARPNATAASLAVNAGVSGADLVASDGITANGVVLRLAGLATSTDPADQIGNLTYVDFFGRIMSDVGSQSANASEAADVQSSVLSQAKNLRAQMSGVSLDEEALALVELQRAYESVAQMTRVLDEMTQTMIGIMR